MYRSITDIKNGVDERFDKIKSSPSVTSEDTQNPTKDDKKPNTSHKKMSLNMGQFRLQGA